jgi:hypothetical protein
VLRNPHLGDGADPERAFKVEADPVQDRAFHVMRKKNLNENIAIFFRIQFYLLSLIITYSLF